MIIALASPCIASTLEEGLDKIKRLLSEASAQDAEIVCFPEAYLPGLRGQDFEVFPFDWIQQERVLETVAQWARTYAVATILGMERLTEAGRQIAAFVIDAQGQIQGYQTKNQLDPTEDQFYVPGNTRRLFEIKAMKFGVVICHEGWRYPETVRWAAVRGAKIVFHPHHTGSDQEGVRLTQWGASDGPYYEKAMMLRSMENTIYFASVNYALRFQESATSLIAPSGQCQAYLPYGQEGVLLQAINVEEATGLLATRYAPSVIKKFQEARVMSQREPRTIIGLENLRQVYKEPRAAARLKALDRLDDFCKNFIALSPFFVLASCNDQGHADASPRGDQPGFVRVPDDHTLLVPDRPGNNRIDTMRNILSNPGVGMIFFVPGFNETLRVNGTAAILQDPGLCTEFTVNGKPALAVIRVSVREVFFHCGKALMRSRLWDPMTYVDRSTFPSHGRILAEQTKTVSVEESEAYVARSYRERLY